MSRLKDMYKDEIVDAMIKKFGYKNIMEVPKLDKIVLNMESAFFQNVEWTLGGINMINLMIGLALLVIGALIIIGSSMGNNGSKEDVASSFKDLVQNLNETTLKLLSSVLSEETLLSMGVEKEYATIAFDVVDALLRELMELKNSPDYENEVNTVLAIYDILTAKGDIEDEQAAELVRQMLKSQVIMNTLDRVSTDILSAELLISLDVPEKYADEICTAISACIDEMLAIIVKYIIIFLTDS